MTVSARLSLRFTTRTCISELQTMLGDDSVEARALNDCMILLSWPNAGSAAGTCSYGLQAMSGDECAETRTLSYCMPLLIRRGPGSQPRHAATSFWCKPCQQSSNLYRCEYATRGRQDTALFFLWCTRLAQPGRAALSILVDLSFASCHAHCVFLVQRPSARSHSSFTFQCVT